MMNTIPGYSKKTFYYNYIFLCFLCFFVVISSTFLYGQGVKFKDNETIKIDSNKSLTFLKGNVYPFGKQIIIDNNNQATKINDVVFYNSDNGEIIATNLSNFNNKYSEIKSFKYNILSDSIITDYDTNISSLNNKIKELENKIINKNTPVYIWISVGLSGLILGIVSMLLKDYFLKKKRNKNLEEGSTPYYVLYHPKLDLNSLTKLYGLSLYDLELFNPKLNLKNLKKGDKLIVKKEVMAGNKEDSIYKVNLDIVDALNNPSVISAFKKALDESLSNSNAIIEELSKKQHEINERQSIIDTKEQEIQNIKNDLTKNQEFNIHLSKLKDEFREVNIDLVEFVRKTLDLIDSIFLTHSSARELNFENNPVANQIVDSLLLNYNKSVDYAVMRRWIGLLEDIKYNQRVYISKLKLVSINANAHDDFKLGDEIMYEIRGKLLKEFLNQSIILAEALSNLANFDGVKNSASVSKCMGTFKNIYNGLKISLLSVNIEINYFHLGDQLNEFSDYDPVQELTKPYDFYIVEKGCINQIVSYGLKGHGISGNTNPKIVIKN